MRLKVLVATIFCLVYLVKQGSNEQIKTIRQIVYHEDHFGDDHQSGKNVDSSCDCSVIDVKLPTVTFHQLGRNWEFLWQELRRASNNKENLAALDPRLENERETSRGNNEDDDNLPALDPRLKNESKNNKGNNDDDHLPALDPRLTNKDNDDGVNEDNGNDDNDKNHLPALDPQLKQSDSENNEKNDSPALDTRLTQAPTENSEEQPKNANTPVETPTDQSEESEPVITPEEWARFISVLTPRSAKKPS